MTQDRKKMLRVPHSDFSDGHGNAVICLRRWISKLWTSIETYLRAAKDKSPSRLDRLDYGEALSARLPVRPLPTYT